jgi:hypothetical protein
MQTPLSPEESAKHIVVQPGFELEAVGRRSRDHQAHRPRAGTSGAACGSPRPSTIPTNRSPRGRAATASRSAKTPTATARADKFTIFADKLTIPTSLCFANGGLIVIEGGHTLFLQDTNGDDKADVRKVLFSGWGMGDTHATASNLRYGVDNWIYGTVGYSGFDGDGRGQAATSSAWVCTASRPTDRPWNSSAPATTTPGASA